MIEAKNLLKRYGGHAVVNDVSLSVRKGTVFGFLGPNGSGKTTTIKMLVGLLEPDKGHIAIGGKAASDPAMRQRIGFMPEAPYFYDRLSGLEFLRFCRDLFNSPTGSTEKDLEEILKEVGIYDARHRPIWEYSKGMKQRLAFAQTMVNDPDFIFLDEPLDGLDPIGRRELKQIIKKMNAAGKTFFFNSHILFDTEELCDTIGIIYEGKLLYTGDVGEFCNGKPLEERFVSTIQAQIKTPA